MTVRDALDRVLQQDTLNFVLTNRLPRRLLTRRQTRSPVAASLCSSRELRHVVDALDVVDDGGGDVGEELAAKPAA